MSIKNISRNKRSFGHNQNIFSPHNKIFEDSREKSMLNE